MVYILFIAVVIPYLFYLGRVKSLNRKYYSWEYYALALPIIFIWILIIGGQYAVGTDYFSYLNIFSGKNLYYLESKGDVAFSGFVSICNKIGFYGQDIFFILSFIWILLILSAFKNIANYRYVYLMMFLFITLATSFNNQMNGVRQYTAIYLFTYGLLLLINRKYISGSIAFLVMIFVHTSSIAILVILPIIMLISKKIESKRILAIFILTASLLSFLLDERLIDYVLPYFKQYAVYASDGRLQETSIVSKLTKFVYLPLYFYSIARMDKLNLSAKKQLLYNLGIISFSCKMAVLNIDIVRRIGNYFEILMCIPIAYLMMWLIETKQQKKLLFTVLYLLAPYMAKVTFFAVGEYEYHSFFLQ